LRGEWPGDAARALGARLRYAKRLATEAGGPGARATLAGFALALAALARVCGRPVAPGELVFARGAKPQLAASAAPGARPDFSISHSGPWVGCAAIARGRVGFDLEMGSGERIEQWVAREATLKASGVGLATREPVVLSGQEARCRGERWHAHALAMFAGAAACLMTDRAVRELEVRALPLAELFAP